MPGLVKRLVEAFHEKPIVSGPVYLRPPAGRDFREWARLRAESRAFLEPWEPAWTRDSLSRRAYARRLRAYALNERADTGYAFFVFRRDDDALVGGVTLNHVRRGVSQSCSIGYWVGRAHARQGYMTAALTGLLPYAFDSLGLHRVSAACLPHNAASRAVLVKVGFTEEGYARKYLRIDGEWRDHVLYAMLSNDPRPALAPRLVASSPRPRFAEAVDEALARTPEAGAGTES